MASTSRGTIVASAATEAESDKADALTRLLEKQEEQLEAICKRIDLWSKYKEDYQELKQLITSMKDKVRHPYKVPIAGSRLAFLSGHIIHTNELVVLLGDNYFALRSASQAIQIIDRRLANLKDMMKKSEEAKNKTENWIKAAEEHKRDKEEFVEIIETM